MTLCMELTGISNFDAPEYPLWDTQAFIKLYKDDKLLFFNSLALSTIDLLEKAIKVLEFALETKDIGEWCGTTFGVRSIAQTMLLTRLSRCHIDANHPNTQDYLKIKDCILDTIQVIKVHYDPTLERKKWCC